MFLLLTLPSFFTAEHEEAVKSEFNTSIRYGAHTDYQGFTILRPDKNDWHYVTVPFDQDSTDTSASATVNVLAGGLEVFHRGSQQWMQVKIPKHLNALVINAGQCAPFSFSFYIFLCKNT